MNANLNQAIVIDCGTGYTKVGYAGNPIPSAVFPTAIAYRSNVGVEKVSQRKKRNDGLYKSVEDLDYLVGENAFGHNNYIPTCPIQHGIIQDWNSMEKIFDYSLYQELRCNPEEHYFLITEPFNNTPENREYTAEVLFETFNAPGMYIATQAVLCLYASELSSNRTQPMDSAVSGVVVDAGEGGTSIIPVSEGYVLGTAVKTLPLGGRDISEFILRRLRERGEPVPSEAMMETVRFIKENLCYCCGNLMKEFTAFDADRSRFQRHGGTTSRGQTWEIDVGYEQFLGPELFFNPEILNPEYTTPLASLVDQTIMHCPVDTRRGLFSNIVVAGGSTKFKGFDKRLQRDLNRLVKSRYEANLLAVKAKLNGNVEVQGKQMEVHVSGSKKREIASWLGGSYVASQNEFYSACVTRAEYEEKGAKVARKNALVKVD
ncbi:hypothetical protein WA538_001366 [Blastocystis sp. DL]